MKWLIAPTPFVMRYHGKFFALTTILYLVCLVNPFRQFIAVL